MRKRKNRLLELLFPPKCVFCLSLLSPADGEREICGKCRKSLPKYTGGKKADFVKSVTAPYRYEGDVKASLRRFKFSGRAFYARAYAPLLAEKLWEEKELSFDTLSYVPLHPKRRRRRGYDQSRRLAEELGTLLNMEAKPLLMKVRSVPPQSRTGNAAARRANISGCYAPLPGAAIEGARILLVDDIVTTGSTLSECARELLMNGAEEVYGAAVACARVKP